MHRILQYHSNRLFPTILHIFILLLGGSSFEYNLELTTIPR